VALQPFIALKCVVML